MLLSLVAPVWANSWSSTLPDLWREDGGEAGAVVTIGGPQARAGVTGSWVTPVADASGLVVVNDFATPLGVEAALSGLGGDPALCVFSLSHPFFADLVVRDPMLRGEASCGGAFDVVAALPGLYTLDLSVRQGVPEVYGTAVDGASLDVLLNDPPQVTGVGAAPGTGGHSLGADLAYSFSIADDWFVSGAATLRIVVTDPNGTLLLDETTEADPGLWTGGVPHHGVDGRYRIDATYDDGYGAVTTTAWHVALVEDPALMLTSSVDGSHADPGDEVELTASVVNRSGPVGGEGNIRIQRDDGGTWRDVGSCAVASGTPNPSCVVAWPSGTDRGTYQFQAVYEETSSGATATSASLGVLVDDAPTLTVSWDEWSTDEAVADVDEGAPFTAVVADLDVPAGVTDLLWAACDAGAASDYESCRAAGARDAGAVLPRTDNGNARDDVLPKAFGEFEVWFVYEDPHGLAAEAGPLTLRVNAAPTVTLASDGIDGGPQVDYVDGVLTIPEGVASYDLATLSFTTGDGDDASLVLSASAPAGSTAELECADEVTNLGACTLALSDLSTVALGSYEVTVTAEDDVERVDALLLTIAVVDGGSFDHDGDGYVADAELDGLADCDPLDATVNPGAADVCNDVDDDCDGFVNDGEIVYDNEYLLLGSAYDAVTVSDEDATTIADSTGATCTLSSTTECVAEGSIYATEDADWWAFQVRTDGSGALNAAFSIEVEMPTGALGATTAPWSWVLDIRMSQDGATWYTMDEMYALTGIQYVTEPTTTTGDAFRRTLTWQVSTSDRESNELYWRVGIGSTILDEDAVWDEDMCGTADATVYTLTVSD